MKKWLFLSAAILSEVTGSLALRAALDHFGWYVPVVAGYIISFVALSYALREGLGVGVVYGIWAACGVVLIAALATVIFGDPLTVPMGLGIVLVIGGVLCVQFGSQAATAKSGDSEA